MLARRFALLVQTALTTGMLVIPGCYSSDNDRELEATGGTSSGGSGGRGGRSGAGGSISGSGGSSSGGTSASGGSVGSGGTSSGGSSSGGTSSGGSSSGGTSSGGSSSGGSPSGGSGGSSSGGSAGTSGSGGSGGTTVDTEPPEILGAALAANGATLTLTFQAGEDLADLTDVDPEKFRLSVAFIDTLEDCAQLCSGSYCYGSCYNYAYNLYYDVGEQYGSGAGAMAISALSLSAQNTIVATLQNAINPTALCAAFGTYDDEAEVGLYLHYTDDLLGDTEQVRDEADNELAPIAEFWAVDASDVLYIDALGGDYCYTSCEPAPCDIDCTPPGAPGPGFTRDPIKVTVTCP